MTDKTLTRSFAGGVITPEMFGRLDQVKHQTGLAEAENFRTLPHGPSENRAGFGYTLEVKDSNAMTCLLPFIYSTDQSMVLEFGNFYVRFHTQGGTLLYTAQAITNITQAAQGVLTYTGTDPVTGTWMFLTGIVGMTQLNNRYVKVSDLDITANTFKLTDLAGNYIDTTSYGAYTSGGTMAPPYEIVSPYATADLFDLHFTQSEDVLTITEQGYQQRELRRLGATNWQFLALTFAPAVDPPASATVVASPAAGATVNRYQVTAVKEGGLEESYPVTVTSTAGTAITGVTQANPGVILSVAHGRAVGDPIFISAVLGMTQINGDFLVNTVPDADHITLKTTSGVVVDTTTYSAWTSGGTVKYSGVVNDLAGAVGRLNTITTALVTGAIRYNVYKYFSGLWGYIGQTSENTFVDNNIVADTTRTPPLRDPVMAATGDYPAAVGYFQGRRLFAGTINDPQRFFATRSASESNMTYSIPTRDSDRLSLRVRSRKASAIRHIVPLEDLVLLGASGPWVLFSSSGVLTGATADPRPKGAIGASNVQPSITGQSVLYKTDRGNRTREFAFRGDVNGGYNGVDISIMAPHYFDRYSTTQMAFTTSPHPTHWEIRSDGALLGLTYVPEQQIAAWHSHTTQGYFESICSVPEGSEDVLYAVIRRTVNGRTVRYIERQHSRFFDALADAFFLDAAVLYSGAPATVFTGLWHLEGETVNALADGAVIRDLVVANGQVTIDDAASKVLIGLQITGRMKTLPLAMEAAAGAQGTQKNINKVHLRVSESSSIYAGPSYDRVKQVKQRTTEPYGSPPALVSDEVEVTIPGDWNAGGQVCVQQVDPLPLTVLSLVLEVARGG